MTPLDVLHQIRAVGATLAPCPDGTVQCRAPQGALTAALLDLLRQHKAAVHTILEAIEERSAIAEHDGGLPRHAADALAWSAPTYI